MEKENRKELFIEIEGRKIPARIWIGDLFNCPNSLVLFSIFVILPYIAAIIGIGKSDYASSPLFVFWNLINICGVLSWIYGINDLSKLRKKGFIELNISIFSLDISLICSLILFIIHWELSWHFFISLFILLLIIFWNNYNLFKIYKGWNKYKHLFTCEISDYIPFQALLFIFLIIYLGRTFDFSTNIFYYLHQFFNWIFE